MVTITGMTEHYRKAFSEDQAKVLAEATVLIEADLVRREDFSKLTATVERLAEAQERTEQRMDSLALGLAKLAEAMGQLAWTVRDTQKQMDGLAQTAG